MAVEQVFFTDCAGGKGINPEANGGFQIRACSPGLDEEARSLVYSIGMHYGSDFCSHAPRDVRDRHDRMPLDKSIPIPEDVMRDLPVIWSYDPLGDGRFMLTRLCYAGYASSASVRTGNVFAHTLVFAPEALTPCGHNPLALSRTRLFHSSDPGCAPALQPLSTLETANGTGSLSLLEAPPFREHLADMISALCAAEPSNRPVLLVLEDWRQAAPLVEALLALLPPAARSRTTFCTHETGRFSVPLAKVLDQSKAPHHIVVIPQTDEFAGALQADEYQTRYATFNYPAQRFSELEPARPYAVFAAECARQGRMDLLASYHQFLGNLECELERDAWDVLMPVAQLLDNAGIPRELAGATHALAEVSRRPEQATFALSFIVPHIRALAHADRHEDLQALTSDATRLLTLATTGTASGRAPFVEEIYSLAGQSLGEGKGAVATALLDWCGPERENLVRELLKQFLPTEQAALPVAVSQVHARGTMALAADGLELAARLPEAGLPVPGLVRSLFAAAQAAGCVADVWARIGERQVMPLLDRPWAAVEKELARDLLTATADGRCPVGNLWLHLKSLQYETPPAEKVMPLLIEMAAACAKCPGEESLVNEVLRLPKSLVQSEVQRCAALGRMAEAAWDSPVGTRLLKEHLRTVQQLRPEQTTAARQELAKMGAFNVLRKIFLDAIPAEESERGKTLKEWQGLLVGHPEFLDCVCMAVAASVADASRNQSVIALAQSLTRMRNTSASGPGVTALYDVLALTVPLAPIGKEWRPVFEPPLPVQMSPAAKARVSVIGFMRELAEAAKEPGWSPQRFPHTRQEWTRDAAVLSPAEKTRLVQWCMDTFAASEAPLTVAYAEALTQMLAGAGVKDPSEVSAAVWHLLQVCGRERDPFTQIEVARAFADCALRGPSHITKWAPLLGALVRRFQRDTRRGFEDHLALRLGPRDESRTGLLRKLCLEADLDVNRVAPHVTRDSATPQPEGPSVTTAARGVAKRVLGWFRSGDEPETPTQENKNRRE